MSVGVEVFSDRAALLEAIILSSQDAILTKDLNGIVTSWNPAAEKMFGYTAAEMVGKSILTLIPDELKYEETEIQRKLRAGERIEQFETMRVTKNGKHIYVSLTISPLRDQAGTIVGASKIIRDIGNKHELDMVQKRMATIVESSNDAILSKTLDGIVTSWNIAAQHMFGYAPDEIIGKSILVLIPHHLHGEETQIIAKLRAGQRIDHFETTRMTKDGKALDVSLTISPIRNSKGEVVGASKILRDISERKILEQSLLQAEKLAATGRMAATIAHKINNPLEGLVNLIYLAKTADDAPMEVVQYLAAAEEELQRISHIAKQTLGFYREHKSAMPISIASVVHDVVEVYGPRLKRHCIELELDLKEFPKIVARRGELLQAISNLVVNSIYAMTNGGALSIAIKEAAGDRKGQGIVASISDTGVGISEEDQLKIFEPFFTTRGEIGTGIGLWVAKQFVEGHLGTLTVDSIPGKGTTMRIFLPWENAYGQLQRSGDTN